MQHITLSGKDYPVAFGYGALMEYETLTGKSALSLLTEGAASLTDTFTLIACALTNGAEKAGNPQSFSPKFAADLIDGTPNSVEVVTQIMRLLESSFATDESAKKKTMYPNRETRRKAG